MCLNESSRVGRVGIDCLQTYRRALANVASHSCDVTANRERNVCYSALTLIATCCRSITKMYLIRDAMRLTDPSVYMYDADTTENLSGMLYDDRAI